MSIYQTIMDKAEQERIETERRGLALARKVELYSKIFVSLREICRLWITDPDRAEATANHLKSILYHVAELHLGERPKRL